MSDTTKLPAEQSYPAMAARAKAAPPPPPPVKAAAQPLAASAHPVPTSQLEQVSGDEELNRRIAELREKRSPFGKMQQKLAYAKRPGYHRHWFTDVPGRVDQAKEAGYEHVKDHEGKIVQKNVGRHRDGRGQIGYLMEIPEVLWKEDMAINQTRADETEAAIKRGVASGQDGKSGQQGNFYVPTTGISIKNETRR